jgi:hypothetical protein
VARTRAKYCSGGKASRGSRSEAVKDGWVGSGGTPSARNVRRSPYRRQAASGGIGTGMEEEL